MTAVGMAEMNPIIETGLNFLNLEGCAKVLYQIFYLKKRYR